MKKDVKRYVDKYHMCQTHKVSTLSPIGLLQPLPILECIWEEVAIDFIGGLPLSNGFDCIMVVVDCLNKYGHFILLKHPLIAQRVVK